MAGQTNASAAGKPAAAPPKKPLAKAAPKTPAQPFDLSGYLAEQLSEIAPTDVITSPKMRAKIPGVIPSRVPTLDAALGRGGWPMSRLCIVTGTEGVGKTSVALHACRSTQEMGGVVVYLDQEHKLDIDYARSIGVDVDKMLLSQPTGLEFCFPIMSGAAKMMASKAPDRPLLIVLDSMNAARTIAEFEENDPTKVTMSAQARVMSRMLPKLVKSIHGMKVCVLFISQPRAAMGGTASWTELVACGKAPKMYAAVIVSLERDGFLKRGDTEIGSKVNARVIKNQVAPPFKEAPFNFIWGHGIDIPESQLQRGIQLGLMTCTKGIWECPYPFDKPVGEPLKWQGAAGLARIVKAHPEFMTRLIEIDRETYNVVP